MSELDDALWDGLKKQWGQVADLLVNAARGYDASLQAEQLLRDIALELWSVGQEWEPFHGPAGEYVTDPPEGCPPWGVVKRSLLLGALVLGDAVAGRFGNAEAEPRAMVELRRAAHFAWALWPPGQEAPSTSGSEPPA